MADAAPANPGTASDAQGQAARLTRASEAIQSASDAVQRLQSVPPASTAIDQLRHDLQLAQMQFAARQAVRSEQPLVYSLAAHPDTEAATVARTTGPHRAGFAEAASGLQALWRLQGVDDPTKVEPLDDHPYAAAEPVESLESYYRAAAARAGIDWSYLAAINYVESDFGRVAGASSAGALGPMQFLPSTWAAYGGGGDITSARDSISAAALFLADNGAPRNYAAAVLHYNHDQDYVATIEGYAAAIRADPLWLMRFYYWSTFG